MKFNRILIRNKLPKFSMKRNPSGELVAINKAPIKGKIKKNTPTAEIL